MLVLKINGLGSAMLGDQCHKPKPKRRRKRSEREVPRISLRRNVHVQAQLTTIV